MPGRLNKVGQAPNTRTLPAGAIFLSILLAVLLCADWAAQRMPSAARPDGGGPAAFSAARAQAHVRALAATPRPAGGAAAAAARDYLMRQVRALGLEPVIQRETVRSASVDLTANVRVTLAEVNNVLVRLPGTVQRHRDAAGRERPAAALAIAHYDSKTASLGAADGAASAAAMLETLRVLRADAPPDNDLLFVFTDADAAQALGTRGFVQSHPWLRRAAVVLRFDNAGNRGPLELIDTDGAGEAAVDGWIQAAPDARGSSFMAALYRSLPQRAGAAPLLAAGVPLLHFATTGGTLGGGAWDIPARLSTASLQHEGDTMLALLRHFGTAPPALEDAGRGQVVFALPGLGIVHYSYGLALPLAGLCWLLTALCCRRALRSLRIGGADILHAAFGFLFMAALATFLIHLCWEAQAALPGRWRLGQLVDDVTVRWQVLAFMLLPAAVFVPLQRHLQRRLGMPALTLGVLCAGSTVLTVVAVGAPGASGVLAWPLLAAHAGWLALTAPGTRGRGAALLACVPALALLLPAIHDSLAFLSPSWLLLPSLLTCLLIGLCGPALHGLRLRWIVRPLLLGAAACTSLAYASDPRAPELPAANGLTYFKDTPSWQAFWTYPAGRLDAWTRGLFPNCMHPYLLPYLYGTTSSPVWYAAARRNDSIAYPDITIEKDEQHGEVRHIEFRLRSKNRAPQLHVQLAGAHPLRSSVNGLVLTAGRYRGYALDLHGMQDRDLHFAFDLYASPPFTVFIQERIPGVPESDLPPRPAGQKPALLPGTGTTISADILVFR